jgi:hypothetical protein
MSSIDDHATHALQAVTAAISDNIDDLANRQVQLLLETELPWWDALRSPELSDWLQLFLKNQHFKRWYDENRARLTQP